MTYGLALIEKPGIDGMNWNEIRLLYDLVTGGLTGGTAQVFPVEFEAREHECAAMGFITPEAAELVGYDYEGSGLHDFIASILDDMEKESPDKKYLFKGIDIYLSR